MSWLSDIWKRWVRDRRVRQLNAALVRLGYLPWRPELGQSGARGESWELRRPETVGAASALVYRYAEARPGGLPERWHWWSSVAGCSGDAESLADGILAASEAVVAVDPATVEAERELMAARWREGLRRDLGLQAAQQESEGEVDVGALERARVELERLG